MTQALTTEAMQEIYEAAVHVEATLGDPDAEFDLYCKLDDVGGVEATIRKLIDMVRAANREAQPVKNTVLLEHSGCGYGTQIDMMEVKLNRGDVVVKIFGNIKKVNNEKGEQSAIIYTAPPAPAVPDAVDTFADQVIGTKTKIIHMPAPLNVPQEGIRVYLNADELFMQLENQGYIVEVSNE